MQSFLKKIKKLFDSRVIFRHISPVFSRGQSKTVFFGKFFFEKFDL